MKNNTQLLILKVEIVLLIVSCLLSIELIYIFPFYEECITIIPAGSMAKTLQK